MKNYGLSMETPRTLVSIIQTINQIGYDSLKIVKEFGRIKSFRRLKNDYKILALLGIDNYYHYANKLFRLELE